MKTEITLSTEMVLGFIANEEKDMAEYQALGNREMEYFAIGRLAVWNSLLDVYAK